MRSGWVKGATAGAVVAAVVLVAASLDLPEALGLEEVFFLFAASPLFAFEALRGGGEVTQSLVLVFWWVAVGAAVGWSLSRQEPGGIVFAIVLAVSVVSGHVGTKNSIERQIEGAVKSFGEGLQQWLKPK